MPHSKASTLLLFVLSLGSIVASTNAAIICNFVESKYGFVTVSYSGSLDKSKLRFVAGNYNQGAPILATGQSYFRVGQFVDFYATDSTSPGSVIGNGGAVSPSLIANGSDPFQFDFIGKTLSLPVGYNSGDMIKGEVTFNGSFSYFGLTRGTHVLTWGPGGSESITLNVIPIPEPASMSIFAIGSLVAGYRLHRRKNKTVS